jgi:peptidoglycan hydrolase-like protein with peptidoglycan-binding domain
MRRTVLITGATVVIAGGTVAGVLLAQGSAREKPTAKLPPATAKVIRTTLVDTKTVPGTLGYGERVPIRAAARGTITWIVPVGSTVRRGQSLFRVDERPVVALYGSVPMYRPLRVGAKGADVRQLEENLDALGYTGIAVDGTYTAATAAAVRTWQAGLGVAQSGTVQVGQLVFMPGPIRIAEHSALVGDVIEGGASVLTYTGIAKVVTVDLEVADRPLAVSGRTAVVTVPDTGAVTGKIAEIGAVASVDSDQGAAPDATGSAAPSATIQVTVTIANQNALGSLSAAPVDVDLVSAERKNVLAVPVTALLALTQGGYGVQIVDGAATRIVPVKTGMFGAGQVEISGAGIAEGVTVGVAK